ncbi:unnamed protein product [Effrenium voratum]|uniref:Uncharacterized protein n=1 Tax=Effrenium voratum TaxID=2562239 RepID=A0AA36J316_9DINO|nr:unnamed protein product [Effrenium voratum]CAJ1440014.1 unnamed protein product [Effrenium voratum]
MQTQFSRILQSDLPPSDVDRVEAQRKSMLCGLQGLAASQCRTMTEHVITHFHRPNRAYWPAHSFGSFWRDVGQLLQGQGAPSWIVPAKMQSHQRALLVIEGTCKRNGRTKALQVQVLNLLHTGLLCDTRAKSAMLEAFAVVWGTHTLTKLPAFV